MCTLCIKYFKRNSIGFIYSNTRETVSAIRNKIQSLRHSTLFLLFAPHTGLSDCFNLNMLTNTIEDYVEYYPAAPVPSMSELTVKFSMKSNDKGLQSHYGTIISYGECCCVYTQKNLSSN